MRLAFTPRSVVIEPAEWRRCHEEETLDRKRSTCVSLTLDLKFARVCIEIYAKNEFRDEIEYEDPYGNTYKQKVIYEWRPPRCSNCLNYGHRSENCPEENFENLVRELKRSEDDERNKKMMEILCEEEEEKVEESSNFKGNGKDVISSTSHKEKGNEANNSTESNNVIKQNRRNDLGGPSRAPETQDSKDPVSSKKSNSIESQSVEITIAVHFIEYVSKSAAKKARHKEKRLSDQMEKEIDKKKESSKGDNESKKGVNDKYLKETKAKKKEKPYKDGGKKKLKN